MSVASDAARNQATNSLASTGKSSAGASTGAPVSTFTETMVPLAAFARYGPGSTPLGVNHQGLFVANTISFNLKPGASLSQATEAIEEAMVRLRVPTTIHGSFQGTAQVFQQSLNNEPVLIAAALVVCSRASCWGCSTRAMSTWITILFQDAALGRGSAPCWR